LNAEYFRNRLRFQITRALLLGCSTSVQLSMQINTTRTNWIPLYGKKSIFLFNYIKPHNNLTWKLIISKYKYNNLKCNICCIYNRYDNSFSLLQLLRFVSVNSHALASSSVISKPVFTSSQMRGTCAGHLHEAFPHLSPNTRASLTFGHERSEARQTNLASALTALDLSE